MTIFVDKVDNIEIEPALTDTVDQPKPNQSTDGIASLGKTATGQR